MSRSLFLVLDLNGNKKFDLERIQNCITKLDGIYDIRHDIPSGLFFAQFAFNDDRTIVILPYELDNVVIEGMGDASLQLALEIQQCLDEDVHALDESFTMDIVLSSVNSLDELKRQVDIHGSRSI